MKRLINRFFYLPLLMFLSAGVVQAQALAVTPLGTQSPSALVQNLLGTGVSFSNVTYSGTAWSSGSFTGGNGIIGFDSGIILSDGTAASVVGPNTNIANTCNGLPGDQDLTNLFGGPTSDATVLSFDFVPTFNNVTFQYVFASDEYNLYVGDFDDVFGFFVNGTDAALLPGTSTIVSINTVNNCTNPSYFIDNSNGQSNSNCPITQTSANLNTSMTGLTTVLSVNVAVTPGVTNHIKLAIADAGDCNLDSNVFIRANSFSSGPTATPTSTPTSTPPPCTGNTCTPTDTPTITATFTPSSTPTPSATFTPTFTLTASPTFTATFTPSLTATRTATFTPSFTPTQTATFTATLTPTNTATPTATNTPCGWPGNTCTWTPTFTPTNTPYYADIFTVDRNILRSGDSVSIFVNYTQYPGEYDLRIYNSAGEHIKTLDSQQLGAPVSQAYSWDGKNKYGDPCASGIYILYLIEPYSAKTKKIIVLH